MQTWQLQLQTLLCGFFWMYATSANSSCRRSRKCSRNRRCCQVVLVVAYSSSYSTTLEGLCVEAIFSSLFQPQFRAHEPGRKIADAASGHCHNSHTWPFGQEEVQLREFVSTLHVKPLSGPGNLAADEPHERSESCTTPSPTARLLWHLQRALHQAACHASACARCLNIA